jgi:hypothetical protein
MTRKKFTVGFGIFCLQNLNKKNQTVMTINFVSSWRKQKKIKNWFLKKIRRLPQSSFSMNFHYQMIGKDHSDLHNLIEMHSKYYATKKQYSPWTDWHELSWQRYFHLKPILTFEANFVGAGYATNMTGCLLLHTSGNSIIVIELTKKIKK